MEETITGISTSSEEIFTEITESDASASEKTEGAADIAEDNSDITSQRSEYDELIRTKYKQFYTEDTQRLINRRFKKYKALEARVAELEAEREGFEARLSEEYIRGQQEAEQRLLSDIRTLSSRPDENGLISRRTPQRRDVSSYTRSERAELARRALRGESIKI